MPSEEATQDQRLSLPRLPRGAFPCAPRPIWVAGPARGPRACCWAVAGWGCQWPSRTMTAATDTSEPVNRLRQCHLGCLNIRLKVTRTYCSQNTECKGRCCRTGSAAQPQEEFFGSSTGSALLFLEIKMEYRPFVWYLPRKTVVFAFQPQEGSGPLSEHQNSCQNHASFQRHVGIGPRVTALSGKLGWRRTLAALTPSFPELQKLSDEPSSMPSQGWV